MHAIARAVLVAGLIGATLSLSACFTVAATGLVVAGLAATDRRTIGAQTEDQGIELKAFEALRNAFSGDSGVAVTSYNRRVLLTGQVASAELRQRAADVVARIENVRQVQNELKVAGQVSLGVSATDTTITTRVKAALINDPKVPGNSVKVVTEASTVYLMGILTTAESNEAARVASRISGVSHVVTVFEIVSDEQARRLDQRS